MFGPPELNSDLVPVCEWSAARSVRKAVLFVQISFLTFWKIPVLSGTVLDTEL